MQQTGLNDQAKLYYLQLLKERKDKDLQVFEVPLNTASTVNNITPYYKTKEGIQRAKAKAQTKFDSHNFSSIPLLERLKKIEEEISSITQLNVVSNDLENECYLELLEVYKNKMLSLKAAKELIDSYRLDAIIDNVERLRLIENKIAAVQQTDLNDQAKLYYLQLLENKKTEINNANRRPGYIF